MKILCYLMQFIHYLIYYFSIYLFLFPTLIQKHSCNNIIVNTYLVNPSVLPLLPLQYFSLSDSLDLSSTGQGSENDNKVILAIFSNKSIYTSIRMSVWLCVCFSVCSLNPYGLTDNDVGIRIRDKTRIHPTISRRIRRNMCTVCLY